jgi:hypothetical protein
VRAIRVKCGTHGWKIAPPGRHLPARAAGVSIAPRYPLRRAG